MQTVEENKLTNLNSIHLKGKFTKKINSGKIIDTWEFKTNSGDLIGVNAKKSFAIDFESTFEIIIRICLYYSKSKEGKTINQNFTRLLYLHKSKTQSEEMDK